MKRQYIITSAVVLGILMSASCQKDTGDVVQSLQDGRFLSFSPSATALVESDNSPVKASLINEDGSESELDNDMEFQVASWDVKDSKMISFINPFEIVKFVKGEVTQHVNMWITVDGSDDIIEHRWKQGEEKFFYAYANNGSDAVTVEGGNTNAPTMKLTHSLDNQKDVLMGFYNGEGKTGSKMTGTASIAFAHPLAAVEFEIGTVAAPAESFKITGITMEGLYAEGTATMSKDGTIAWSACSGKGSLSQIVSETPITGQVGEPFIVIPQTFEADSARIEISAKYGSTPIKLYIKLKGDTWTGGKISKYTINYNAHKGIQLWENGPYWATCNVGADYPEEYGWFFSWGNVDGYFPSNIVQVETYKSSCVWAPQNGGAEMPEGFTPEFYATTKANEMIVSGRWKETIDSDHDAATQLLGTAWRMPTRDELQGLLDNTDRKMIYLSDKEYGYQFTGRGDYSRRSIFLPVTGYGDFGEFLYDTRVALYWSSTHIPDDLSVGGDPQAYALRISRRDDEDEDKKFKIEKQAQYAGRVIRPVENF